MGIISISLGLGSILTMMLAALLRPKNGSSDPLGAAVLLFCILCVCYLLKDSYTLKQSWIVNAPMDLFFGCLILNSWMRDRAPWKFVLASIFAVQLCAHAAFGAIALRHFPPSWVAEYNYTLVLNVTFVFQLLTVLWPGVRDGFVGLWNRGGVSGRVRASAGLGG